MGIENLPAPLQYAVLFIPSMAVTFFAAWNTQAIVAHQNWKVFVLSGLVPLASLVPAMWAVTQTNWGDYVPPIVLGQACGAYVRMRLSTGRWL